MPYTTVSLAKTTRPTLSMVVNRDRLFNQINAAQGSKALWINGPPGSGKTTLVASFIESRDTQALWYQLDNTDTDAASFFYYLRQSALKHSKDGNMEIPELPTNPDEWNKVLKQINGQTPISEIRCPVCGEFKLDFEYIINFRSPSNPKRNRIGGTWIWCNNCDATVTWDGKIPDWYVKKKEDK